MNSCELIVIKDQEIKSIVITIMYKQLLIILQLLLSGPLFAQENPEAVGEYSIRWEGKVWGVIDEEGVFGFAKTGDLADVPLPKSGRTSQEIYDLRGRVKPVACRLVDFVDATQDTHSFRDDGKSRVLELASGKFRVTGAPKGFELTWFAYDVRTSNQAGRPHLLVAELSNDAERYTTLTLTVPRKEPWSPPYTGQEQVQVDAIDIAQEPLWYEPDVGLSVYTGRDLPIDNQSFLSHFVFYPKTNRMKLTVSSSGWVQPVTEETGGAVSRIWVFEILGELSEHVPSIHTPVATKERHVGVYTTHPWYFLAHYGVPPHTREQRAESLSRMCDTLAFCGMNLIQFNAINGSDRADRAWYPGSYYRQLGADLLSELPPIAERRRIDLIPVVTSLTAPGKIEGGKPNKYRFSELSFQQWVQPPGQKRKIDMKAPDPLRPETQRWLIYHLQQIGRRCKSHRNVIGIGFRVNGKLGTCYISAEDKAQKDHQIVPASEAGYSDWNLREFRRATGLAAPTESYAAYRWLKEDPQRWEQWLDFRCEQTRRCWLAARDAIRRMRSDWQLYVLTDLPSEVFNTNVVWPGKEVSESEREKVTLDLLRSHGFDPRMYRQEEGIVIQRVMMVDMERFFSKWGPPFGSNPVRYRDFHEQEFLPDWYRTAGGSAVEIYHTYWEEPFHPDGEFGSDGKGFGLRTATGMAQGRAFYRSKTFSMRAGNSAMMVLTGWQRPVLGHEHDLRRFSQAVRSLPAVKPLPLAVEPKDAKVFAGWYGDRIGVINDGAKEKEITVILDRSVPAGRMLKDIITNKVLIDATMKKRNRFTIKLLAYDIRTLEIRTR